MNVLLGRQRAAFTNLTFLLDSYILPNTFYREARPDPISCTPATRPHDSAARPTRARCFSPTAWSVFQNLSARRAAWQ